MIPKLKPIVLKLNNLDTSLEVPELHALHMSENPEQHKKRILETEVLDLHMHAEIPEESLF